MNRRNIIIGLVGIVIVAVIGFAIWWLSAGSGEPSEEISSETLSLNETDTNGGEEATATVEPTDAAAEDEMAADDDAANDEMAADDDAADDAMTEDGDEAADRLLYRIASEESEVRFIIDEELRGTPTTVIGSTDQVAGDIIADFGDPSATQLGMIRINARTLATDNEFRNRALRGQILQSAQDEYEFAEFVPTALTDLPESVTLGEPFSFTIIGDLTLRDITSEVTFSATVTATEEALTGSATATVQRAAFGLQIPDVPGVANVAEDVALEIDFVAPVVVE